MHVQPVEASGLSSTSTSPKRKKSAFDVLLWEDDSVLSVPTIDDEWQMYFSEKRCF
jgi:hypothetical protein